MEAFTKTKVFTRRLLAEKINKKILLSTSLAFLSLEIYVGAVLGYVAGKYYSGVHVKQPKQKVRSLAFRVGGYRIHLHHWLICFGLLISAFLIGYWKIWNPLMAKIFFGFLGGLAIQDLHLDENWHKVLIKEKKDDNN